MPRDAAVDEHTIDGMLISYPSAGERQLLVLLHGTGDNSLDWRWVHPALARKHRVYTPDLPGLGDCAKPVADYSPAFFDKGRSKLGVKPIAPSPIYGPSIVTDAVLHAAENPVRDLVVGAARAVTSSQALSQRFLDPVIERVGFGVHYTPEPKPEDGPENLCGPMKATPSATRPIQGPSTTG